MIYSQPIKMKRARGIFFKEKANKLNLYLLYILDFLEKRNVFVVF